MTAYQIGFIDGLQEALNLMSQEESIDFGPGKILNKIKQLTCGEDTSSDQQPPSDCTCRTDP